MREIQRQLTDLLRAMLSYVTECFNDLIDTWNEVSNKLSMQRLAYWSYQALSPGCNAWGAQRPDKHLLLQFEWYTSGKRRVWWGRSDMGPPSISSISNARWPQPHLGPNYLHKISEWRINSNGRVALLWNWAWLFTTLSKATQISKYLTWHMFLFTCWKYQGRLCRSVLSTGLQLWRQCRNLCIWLPLYAGCHEPPLWGG